MADRGRPWPPRGVEVSRVSSGFRALRAFTDVGMVPALGALMLHTHSLNSHTSRSNVLTRAFLARELDPFVTPREVPEPGSFSSYMYSAGVGGDFDDDDPRWRRKRRARGSRFRA